MIDHQALRAIHHFRHRSVKDLSCVLDGGFWSTYLLRMSSSFPAVQHAVVAFSSLHEVYLAGDDIHPPTAVYSRQQYGRAIRNLCDHIAITSIDGHVMEETLLTCLLFICFEVLQGHDLAALAHLEAGLGIFSSLPYTSAEVSMQPSDLSISALAKIFIRLDNHATSLIGSRPPTLISSAKIHSLAVASVTSHPSPCGIAQARDALHVCLSCAHDFLRSIAETAVPTMERSSLASAIHEKDHHLRSLRAWMQGYLDLLQRVPSSSRNNKAELHIRDEVKGCAVLWLTYLVTFIKLSTSLDPDEVEYDKYLWQFEAIIEHAEAVLGSPTQEETISNAAAAIQPRKRFTIEMDVIHPLYFTAFKCRHLPIRQRAIELMRVAGKEGAWDGVIFARIAQHVQALEEEEAVDNEYGSEGAPFGVCKLKRVHSVGFDIRREKRNVWVQCRRRVAIPLSKDAVPAWNQLESVLSY